MKRIIAMLLVLAMALSLLAGCGVGETKEAPEAAAPAAVKTTVEPTAGTYHGADLKS